MKPKAHHYSAQYQITVCQGEGTGHYWSCVYPEHELGKEVLWESPLTAERDEAFRLACDWVDAATERQLEAALEQWSASREA